MKISSKRSVIHWGVGDALDSSVVLFFDGGDSHGKKIKKAFCRDSGASQSSSLFRPGLTRRQGPQTPEEKKGIN